MVNKITATDPAYASGANRGIDVRTYIATRVAACMSFNYLGSGVHPAGIASHAVQVADELIKELNK